MNSLNQFLKKSAKEELEILQKIIGTKKTSVSDLTKALGKLPLMAGGVFQSPLTYVEIIDQIAKKNDIELINSSSTFEKEKDLFQKLFVKEFDQMNEEEKQAFLSNLEKNGLSKSQIASITSMGAIAAAQASGFGVYLLASSTVGAISSALGITLPFAFYTGMSSALSIAIGPLGFLVIGYLMWKSFKDVKSWDEAKDIFIQSGTGIKNFIIGDKERTEMAFKYIVSLRLIKIKEQEDKAKVALESLEDLKLKTSEIENRKKQIEIELNEVDSVLKELELKLENLKNVIQEKVLEKKEIDSQFTHLVSKLDSYKAELKTTHNQLSHAQKSIEELKGK